ncbi:MAG: outer membrane beta-barrel protein [Acidobacteria bacterium]|nr:outer membrane beta-barrel protein [Acidobacteriota bacterium]
MTRRRSWMPRSLLSASAAALLASALAVPAEASERELYVGFHLGHAGVDVEVEDAFDHVLDGDANSRNYEAGFRFSRYFAVEASYYDFSKVDGTIRPCAEGVPCTDLEVRGKINALSVAIVPQYEVTGRISVFAKVGLVAWGADIEDAAEELELTLDDIDEDDLIYGVGVEIQLLGRLRAVGRIESIGGDIEIFSAGVRLGF